MIKENFTKVQTSSSFPIIESYTKQVQQVSKSKTPLV